MDTANRKKKILVVPSDKTGVFLHRIKNPHVYIQEHYGDEFDIDIVYMSDFPKDNISDFFQKYDMVVVHKQFDNGMKVMNILKYLGIPVILDVDDNPKLGPDHPMHITCQREGWADIIYNHIKAADYVTTTTPLFASILEKYNKNITILPNAIDAADEQFSFKKNDDNNGRLRFGIVCGSAHLKDIELLQGITSLPKETLDKIQFVLCGFDTNGQITVYGKNGEKTKRDILPEESTWTKYEKILTNNYSMLQDEAHKEFLKKYLKGVDDPFGNDVYRRFWTRNINKYATHYENVDVLLAPLKENGFNYTKSQLKEVECGFTDTALIAQKYGPYTIDLVPYIEKGGKINEEGTALLVETPKNHKQWAKYIKYLADNPDVVRKLKDNLSKFVKEKYSLENVSKDRVKLYREVFDKRYSNKESEGDSETDVDIVKV